MMTATQYEATVIAQLDQKDTKLHGPWIGLVGTSSYMANVCVCHQSQSCSKVARNPQYGATVRV